MTTTHFNGLSPAEHERLSQLMEECGEVIQVIGKIMRHGWTRTDHSVVPIKKYDNKPLLEEELGHVKARLARLTRNDISEAEVERHMIRKLNDPTYDHHQ